MLSKKEFMLSMGYDASTLTPRALQWELNMEYMVYCNSTILDARKQLGIHEEESIPSVEDTLEDAIDYSKTL